MRKYALKVVNKTRGLCHDIEIWENYSNFIELGRFDRIEHWPLPFSYDQKLKNFVGPIKLKILVSDVNDHDKHILVEEVNDPITNRLTLARFAYPLPKHLRITYNKVFMSSFEKMNTTKATLYQPTKLTMAYNAEENND